MNGTFTRGKSPRRLHLEFETPEGLRPFGVAVGDRIAISRRRLVERRPWESHSLRSQDRRLLAQWLAKRYDRAAFPAAFDARWKPVRDKIRRLLGRTGHFVDGVFLTVEDRELPEEETYSIVVRGVISIESADDPTRRAQAQECVDGLAALLAECAGIDVLDSALVQEDEFTLHDVSYAKYWDWDWLSIEDR
jgi:hypothetical protein